MTYKRLLTLVLPLLLLCVALGGWWYASHSTGTQVTRIGVVSLTEVDSATFAGFREALQALGYVEGEQVLYLNPGPAGSVDRLDPLIAALLQQGVDLILSSSTPATLRVKVATAQSQIPVVFAPVNDPVGAGVVRSLKHPGGNITGIKLASGDQLRLRWLSEFAPAVRQVYIPFTPQDKSSQASLQQVREVAPQLGFTLLPQPLESATAPLQLPPQAEAIFIPRDSTVEARIDELVALATIHKLPLSAPSLIQVEAGALYTYGFIHYNFGQQAARLAHQIIQGVSPADIPVEQAGNYLVINLQAASVIDLPLRDSLLRQADRLIR